MNKEIILKVADLLRRINKAEEVLQVVRDFECPIKILIELLEKENSPLNLKDKESLSGYIKDSIKELFIFSKNSDEAELEYL